MKIRVLFNPIAGRGRRPRDDMATVQAIFAGHGVMVELICLERKGQAARLARQATEGGYDVVVVVGGDGTVNEAVCGLVNSDVPLGIVPTGSGNGISREFGIPQSLPQACQAILDGQTISVDVGQADGHFFLGTAGVGYDALVGRIFEERWGNYRGMWPYFFSAAKGFFQYRATSVQLRFADECFTVIPLLITVANIPQFGGGAVIAPQARPDDGLLDVCVIEELNFFQALYHWPKLFLGRIHKVPQWQAYRTDRVEISSDLAMPVHVDGEPIGDSRQLQVVVLPSALCLRVPTGGGFFRSAPSAR